METLLTHKVLRLYCKVTGNVLNYFFILFFVACTAQNHVQSNNNDILLLQLHKHKQNLPNNEYTKSQVGDSIILHKKVLNYSIDSNELKRVSIASKSLSIEEADEIFSKEFIKSSDSDQYWTRDQLPDIQVLLFDEDKYTSAVTFKKGEKIGLGTFNILSISKPSIRSDKKYAFIQTSNEHEGGVLHIYKNTNNGWLHYKKIQLYLI